jgi:hypothetical protein
MHSTTVSQYQQACDQGMPSDRGVCVGDGPALPHIDIVMIEGGAASKLQGLITGLSREMTRRMSIHNCL